MKLYHVNGHGLEFHPATLAQSSHRFLNETLPQRWIGRTGHKDLALHSWLPRSPDMTPCDFFLWGYVKERVYVPPLTS